MQSIVEASGSAVNLTQLFKGADTATSTSSLKGTTANATSSNSSIGDGVTPATESSPRTPQLLDPYSPSVSVPPPSLSKESLDFFRSRMLPCFLFMNLTPDITVEQLRQDRPFLSLAIVTVTIFSTQRKLAAAEGLKHILLASALVKVQSNIHLLLGLLTYLAWSTDAFLGGADVVSRLTMLAISLVYDMRLYKPSPPDVRLMMAMTQGQAYEIGQSIGDETIQEFMEK
ncbi:putative Zn(2)-C6 fungal-type domain-containing protein [Seiridium cardinale]